MVDDIILEGWQGINTTVDATGTTPGERKNVPFTVRRVRLDGENLHVGAEVPLGEALWGSVNIHRRVAWSAREPERVYLLEYEPLELRVVDLGASGADDAAVFSLNLEAYAPENLHPIFVRLHLDVDRLLLGVQNQLDKLRRGLVPCEP